MTEPQRLIDDGATEFERALLDSAAGELPSSALSQKMMLGLTGTVALGIGTASTTTAYAATKGGSIASLLKWGAGGAIAVALGWGGYTLTTGPEGNPADVPQVSPVVVEDRSETNGSTEVVPLAADRAAEAPVTTATPASPHKASSAASSATLRQELSLLDRARAALRSGNADEALAAVNAYEKKFPRGTLRQEATVLKVEALKARGSEGQADALAEDFLRKNPDSAHKTRLQPAPTSSPTSQ